MKRAERRLEGKGKLDRKVLRGGATIVPMKGRRVSKKWSRKELRKD
jgi:hypothetical protein